MDPQSSISSGVIIVSGVPGAGKSTIAPLLAAHFERGVHIEADSLQRMIVSGANWPSEEPIEEGFRQLRLRGRNACLLADSFCGDEFVAVIDDIVIGLRLDEYLADLKSTPLYLVLLLPDLDTLFRRNAARPKSDVFDQAQKLDPVAREKTKRLGLRIDTSNQTPGETVDCILEDLFSTGRIA